VCREKEQSLRILRRFKTPRTFQSTFPTKPQSDPPLDARAAQNQCAQHRPDRMQNCHQQAPTWRKYFRFGRCGPFRCGPPTAQRHRKDSCAIVDVTD